MEVQIGFPQRGTNAGILNWNPNCLWIRTGLPPTEYDDTRCCITQFWPPDDEHIVLETCRGM